MSKHKKNHFVEVRFTVLSESYSSAVIKILKHLKEELLHDNSILSYGWTDCFNTDGEIKDWELQKVVKWEEENNPKESEVESE